MCMEKHILLIKMLTWVYHNEVKKAVNEVETHQLSGKEAVSWVSISKEVMLIK